jgi:vancomycin resistance protein VanW
MNYRAFIPKKIKLKFRLLKRYLTDRKIDFALTSNRNTCFQNLISTKQVIKKGAFYENKVHNIKNAATKIESIIVCPNQVFSFWKIVGAPSKKNKYKIGRNIINGKVSEEIGGGLCQLSSIIYSTVLKANLEILERYNHSVDIYQEEERFTPLGSDATVVYGYKDLRFKNGFKFPLKFSFSFIEHEIICNLESFEKIEEKQLGFIRKYTADYVEVSTTLNNKHHCFSKYKFMALS